MSRETVLTITCDVSGASEAVTAHSTPPPDGWGRLEVYTQRRAHGVRANLPHETKDLCPDCVTVVLRALYEEPEHAEPFDARYRRMPPIVRACIDALMDFEETRVDPIGYDISYYAEDLPKVVQRTLALIEGYSREVWPNENE